MSDLADRASEAEQMFRQAALATAAREARLSSGASAVFCEQSDCGQPIPELRRLALPGVSLCVECAERLERMGRL